MASVRWRKRPALAAGVLLCAGAAAGCSSIPADPEGSLEEAREGELHIGITEHPPWTEIGDSAASAPGGTEVDLLNGYAERLGAEIIWVPGSESELLGQLAEQELDVVIGGFDSNTPWQKEGAITRPYREDPDGSQRVVLVEQGENALLMDLESYFIELEHSGQEQQ